MAMSTQLTVQARCPLYLHEDTLFRGLPVWGLMKGLFFFCCCWLCFCCSCFCLFVFISTIWNRGLVALSWMAPEQQQQKVKYCSYTVIKKHCRGKILTQKKVLLREQTESRFLLLMNGEGKKGI